jgi:hypothetical protein
MRFSQRLSADDLVLDLREDECGFRDVADAAGIEADVLERVPSLLEQREAAFSLVAQAAERHVAGFGVGVELAFAGLYTGNRIPAPPPS